MVVRLVKGGWLVGVQVFGTEHFGLCDQIALDRPNPSVPVGVFAGSDCNRAERWLMRPNDPLMTEELASMLKDDPT